MLDGKGGRNLPVLAAVLLAAALAVGLAILLIRIPEERKFDEHLLAANLALRDGDGLSVRRELLKASRNAVSADQWTRILRISGEQTADGGTDAFKLFTTLAGRASASLPGNEDFYAYWSWGLLRSGNITKAEEQIDFLPSPNWSALRAEIRLKSLVGDSPEDVEVYVRTLTENPDPEFLSQAAMLTESGELTFDAALLYMRQGRVEKAFEHVQLLDNGSRSWADETTFSRRGVADAMAAIAQDAGRPEDAIRWLTERVDDTRRRRVSTWESLQFLGDLHWDTFRSRGTDKARSKAGEAWTEAVGIVRAESENGSMPEDAWRLWLNLAVLEESRGNIRESDALLEEALVLFPGREEVKAAWSMGHKDSEPALARRLVREAYEQSGSPVLGITVMKVDPDSVSPRLYEAKLWELFDAAADPAGNVHAADARTIATFVLDYMSSRKNFSSVDVAVDRYRKAHPDEAWILSWRLAADAARGMSLVDMVGIQAGSISPYEEFRAAAGRTMNWRALHDAALFSVMASNEMQRSAARLSAPNTGRVDPESAERAYIALISSYANQSRLSGTPMLDRVNLLLRNHDDEIGRKLNSSTRQGREAAEAVKAAIMLQSRELLENALEDLSLAVDSADAIDKRDSAALYYLQALVLDELGRTDEALEKAREAVEADPEHNRARELLTSEVSA
jgi:tetratricopeptide (TPR) repeat protein